jgi:hypothetical protein
LSGSPKWEWTDKFIEYFQGAEIIILPDHDDPGRAWAAECVRLLTGVAFSVKIVSLGLRGEGADIVNWLDAGHTAEELLALVDRPAMPVPTHDAYYEQRAWSMPRIEDVTDPTEVLAIRSLLDPVVAEDVKSTPAKEPGTETRKTPVDQPWGRDAVTIPPRQFLFGKHYVRGAVSSTIGAGGRAKTTLSCEEAVSMAVGRDLMTGAPLKSGPLRVWMLNGEEVQDEIDRRICAILQQHKMTVADLGRRLWARSVRDNPMRIARGAAIVSDVVDQMVTFIRRNEIDVFMIDPLVSFHDVPENDNSAMDKVIKQGFGAVAGKTNSAGELFHQPGKPKPGQPETTVEDGRGASAILWAVRSARVLNFMTTAEANQFGVPEEERRRHIRISKGKANMGPVGGRHG